MLNTHIVRSCGTLLLAIALLPAAIANSYNAKVSKSNFHFETLARASSSFLVPSKTINQRNGRYRVATRTPAGVRVFAVKQPSAAMLQTIDAGFADLFALARRNGYRRFLNYSDYTIYIATPARTKNSRGEYSPDIAVNAAQYAGTDYDAGGYIYAAGMVSDLNNGTFIIAEHTGNLARVRDIVRYEGEHIVLYHNDARRFQATADHSRGGGHPILK